MPYTFRHPVRVYVEDTDAAGIVYHTNHIKYMERGRTEALRDCGFTKVSLDKTIQLYFVVKDIHIDYKVPILMDDLLEVRTTLDSVSKARLYFTQELFRDEVLMATAKLTLVCINKDLKPTPLPETMAKIMSEGPNKP